MDWQARRGAVLPNVRVVPGRTGVAWKVVWRGSCASVVADVCCLRLLPPASREAKELVTNVLTPASPVCQKQMIRRSASRGSYEAPQSFVSREYNSVLESVVGMLASALIATLKDGRASRLRRLMGGAAPGGGESHFGFPSDRLEWSCRDTAFDVRDGESEEARPQLEAVQRRVEAEWVAGIKSGVAQSVPGRPARLSIGGVGGGCMLALTQEPALRST